MGRIFGILFLVLGLWVALEVYTEGVHGAFGGAFAFMDGGRGDEPADTRSTPERVRETVGGAHAEADARRQRLLDD